MTVVRSGRRNAQHTIKRKITGDIRQLLRETVAHNVLTLCAREATLVS